MLPATDAAEQASLRCHFEEVLVEVLLALGVEEESDDVAGKDDDAASWEEEFVVATDGDDEAASG